MVEPPEIEQLAYCGQSKNHDIKNKNDQAHTGSAAARNIFTGFSHLKELFAGCRENNGRQKG